MTNLATNYLGITLKNPIIASSSGLTSSLQNIIDMEANGAAAVVLKSLFEEEIIMEAKDNLNKMHSSGFIYPETIDYFDFDAIEDPISNYLKLIVDAKKAVKIPIIASINCVTPYKWPEFAKRIQNAGADALELNVFALPTDLNRSAAENDQLYIDIIEQVTKYSTIPIAVKISPFNSALASFIKKLSETPVKGIVLFNRFYSPDFDINNFELTSTNVFSTKAELALPLRWIAIMSNRTSCDLAASTGVHDGHAVVKALLAGASVTQIATTLYQNGFEHISLMLKQLEDWMKENQFSTIADFKGKMIQSRYHDPAAFERVQFMKFFKDLKR